MSLGFLIGVFVVALAFVLVSIIKFNLHPFLSLLLGGLIMGILAGLPLTAKYWYSDHPGSGAW